MKKVMVCMDKQRVYHPHRFHIEKDIKLLNKVIWHMLEKCKMIMLCGITLLFQFGPIHGQHLLLLLQEQVLEFYFQAQNGKQKIFKHGYNLHYHLRQ